MSPPVIHLDHVSVSFDGTGDVLRDVTLTVEPGEFVYVIGPTGAGKSTLLRLLYCDAKPTSGCVTVEGQDLCQMRRNEIPRLRRRMGVVFQDFGLLQDRNVYENVAFALRVIGVGWRQIRQRVPDVLQLVGLGARMHAFPKQLSGGERQRVAIARALVNSPPLLLADEPTGNLDPDTSIGIGDLLECVNAMGTTIVVATHDKHLVDTFPKRVVHIEDGRIVRDQNPGTYDGWSPVTI